MNTHRIAAYLIAAVMGTLFVLSAPGCSSLQPGGMDITKMTESQIKAATADKSASATCVHGQGAWGTTRVVSVNLDKSTIPTGGVTVDPDCRVTMTTDAPHRAASAGGTK